MKAQVFPSRRPRSFGLSLFLLGLLLAPFFCGFGLADVHAEEVVEKNWEPFAARFRRPLPANTLSAIRQDLAVAHAQHLREPKHVEHLAAVASLYFQLLEFNSAAEAYLQLLILQPDNQESAAWFAECLYHAGSLDPAQGVFEKLEQAGKRRLHLAHHRIGQDAHQLQGGTSGDRPGLHRQSVFRRGSQGSGLSDHEGIPALLAGQRERLGKHRSPQAQPSEGR